MKVTDKNQTLVPPEGYTFIFVSAEGGYLRLQYQKILSNSMSVPKEEWTAVVYLNDQGREVLRTEEKRDIFPDPDPLPAPPPQTWWEEVKSDFKFMFGRGE